jgi:hypothetical protein
MYTITNKKGFTLVETLFYIAGLVLLLAVISMVFIYMYDWYRAVTIVPRVDQVGMTLVDKIVKDIHSSSTINPGSSSLGTTNGSISLTGSVNLVNVTKNYSIVGNCITYQQDSGAISCISPNGITITRFYLIEVDSPISKALKFDIDISYSTKQGTTTRTYSSFAILKQSYE